MTTIFIATRPKDIRNLMPWAKLLSESRGEDLVLLITLRRTGETRLVNLPDTPEDDESELVTTARETLRGLPSSSNLTIQQLVGEEWPNDIAELVGGIDPGLAIVPAPTISRDQSPEDDWQTMMLTATHCDIMMIRDDAADVAESPRLAVFVNDGLDNESALRYALKLAAAKNGTTTAVYIQPDVTDHAASVGRRQLDRLLNRVLRSSDQNIVRTHVIVASSVTEAFKKLNATDFDLLMTGSRDHRQIRKFLQARPVPDGVEPAVIPAVAVLKRGESLRHRLYNRINRAIRQIVPQLTREEKIELMARVQDSSKWDFDFVFLICLSTLIACLGLAEDSGPVIVGAMLVAPLMTPIAGVGLGVAYANSFLTKFAFRTAVRGFVTAWFIGILFGLCVQAGHQVGWLESLAKPATEQVSKTTGFAFPAQMEARTQPQFYDLLIALASGIAGAYAMGRPNLISALPGVAIAAALVPPIATSGIALSHGDIVRSAGALILFLTNMVTITLGASLIFRTVGVRSQKDGPHAARWPRYVLLTLVILSVLITVMIELKRRHF